MPVFGTRWDISVIRSAGTRELRKILRSIRNSKLPDRDYSAISTLCGNGVADKADFPIAWGRWRSLVERFNLDDERPLDERFVVSDTCIKLGWAEPAKFALIDSLTLNATITRYDLKIETFQLWRARVLVFADTSGGAALALKGASGGAETLLTRLKAVTLADSAIKKDVSLPMRNIKLAKSFPDIGPTAKLAKLRQAAANKDKIKTFSRTSTHANALTGVRFCFQSFASAVRCYFSFCELRGIHRSQYGRQ